ncbi:uncharacterized protein G2W53_044328 [Senna tora]|uniref:Uncharacterized protein n=1 Tax=Senna tora TaxID=362788 RepID=A0A834SQC7_9FABA|nr:uncharacterized protein G2W53_044328 [Senna tora]
MVRSEKTIKGIEIKARGRGNIEFLGGK